MTPMSFATDLGETGLSSSTSFSFTSDWTYFTSTCMSPIMPANAAPTPSAMRKTFLPLLLTMKLP